MKFKSSWRYLPSVSVREENKSVVTSGPDCVGRPTSPMDQAGLVHDGLKKAESMGCPRDLDWSSTSLPSRPIGTLGSRSRVPAQGLRSFSRAPVERTLDSVRCCFRALFFGRSLGSCPSLPQVNGFSVPIFHDPGFIETWSNIGIKFEMVLSKDGIAALTFVRACRMERRILHLFAGTWASGTSTHKDVSSVNSPGVGVQSSFLLDIVRHRCAPNDVRSLTVSLPIFPLQLGPLISPRCRRASKPGKFHMEALQNHCCILQVTTSVISWTEHF